MLPCDAMELREADKAVKGLLLCRLQFPKLDEARRSDEIHFSHSDEAARTQQARVGDYSQLGRGVASSGRALN